MYIYIIKVADMHRTQIYLEDEVFQYLENESKIQNLTISELIRRNLRTEISQKQERMQSASEKVFGIWSDRNIDPEEFIRDLRKDRTL